MSDSEDDRERDKQRREAAIALKKLRQQAQKSERLPSPERAVPESKDTKLTEELQKYKNESERYARLYMISKAKFKRLQAYHNLFEEKLREHKSEFPSKWDEDTLTEVEEKMDRAQPFEMSEIMETRCREQENRETHYLERTVVLKDQEIEYCHLDMESKDEDIEIRDGQIAAWKQICTDLQARIKAKQTVVLTAPSLEEKISLPKHEQYLFLFDTKQSASWPFSRRTLAEYIIEITEVDDKSSLSYTELVKALVKHSSLHQGPSKKTIYIQLNELLGDKAKAYIQGIRLVQ